MSIFWVINNPESLNFLYAWHSSVAQVVSSVLHILEGNSEKPGILVQTPPLPPELTRR